ncbi:MAG: sigma-70 family RNA polymerase sigma factor [Actinobacteria bacterium]|nr:MAG: sigma-70 family RNA polymerase sigma factor [Actinomycetota bacterium]
MQVPQQLIESVRRGEPGAFEELVRSTHRPVYSLVYRIVGNADDAADVTQDVYLRVWRGLRGFRGDANFSTWLYRVAANAALTHVKRRARGGVPTEPSELPDLPASDGTEERADAELLERALATLPDSQRAVVVLKDVYGWTCAEIGKQMGTTEGAVKVRLFRARQRLADELATSQRA